MVEPRPKAAGFLGENSLLIPYRAKVKAHQADWGTGLLQRGKGSRTSERVRWVIQLKSDLNGSFLAALAFALSCWAKS